MTSEVLKSIVLPLVCGLVPVITAWITTRSQRRQDLNVMRLDAYKKFETALSEWTKVKNVISLAEVYETANVCRFLCERKTETILCEILEFIQNHQHGIPSSLIDEFHKKRLALLNAMRREIQSSKPWQIRSK